MYENLFSFFKKEKKTRLAEFDEKFFQKLEFVNLFCEQTSFFFRVSNRSRYLVDRYIIWTNFNNLKYSVGVESLVRH